MAKEHLVNFLKYHVVAEGETSVEMGSEIERTIVAGEDENSVILALTIHKNGLMVLVNSETQEFWSNFKPVSTKVDGKTVITFEM